MTAISVEIEQLKRDMSLLAKQQLEFDKRLKSKAAPAGGITEQQADVIFDVVKKALDKMESKITASHGSVHRAAINEVRDSAMAATMLGRATFTEACDTLKQSIEYVLAGTGAKA